MPARKTRTSSAPALRLGPGGAPPHNRRKQTQKISIRQRGVQADLFVIEKGGVDRFSRNADVLDGPQHGRAAAEVQRHHITFHARRPVIAQDAVKLNADAHV